VILLLRSKRSIANAKSIMYKVSQSKYHQVVSMNIFDTYMYSVEQNDCHLVCFGIVDHVNIPVPLYFFWSA
jgi:hypothetical protein